MHAADLTRRFLFWASYRRRNCTPPPGRPLLPLLPPVLRQAPERGQPASGPGRPARDAGGLPRAAALSAELAGRSQHELMPPGQYTGVWAPRRCCRCPPGQSGKPRTSAPLRCRCASTCARGGSACMATAASSSTRPSWWRPRSRRRRGGGWQRLLGSSSSCCCCCCAAGGGISCGARGGMCCGLQAEVPQVGARMPPVQGGLCTSAGASPCLCRVT